MIRKIINRNPLGLTAFRQLRQTSTGSEPTSTSGQQLTGKEAPTKDGNYAAATKVLLQRLVAELNSLTKIRSELDSIHLEVEAMKISTRTSQEESKRLQGLIFQGDLSLWLRDTVIADALHHPKIYGKLKAINLAGKMDLDVYLPHVMRLCVTGQCGGGPTYNAKLISNFAILEDHIQQSVGLSLRNIFTSAAARDSALGVRSPPQNFTNAEIDDGLMDLFYILESARIMSCFDAEERAEAQIKLRVLHRYFMWLSEKADVEMSESFDADRVRWFP